MDKQGHLDAKYRARRKPLPPLEPNGNTRLSDSSDGDHRDHDGRRDDHHGSDNRGLVRGPSGDRVQPGRDRPPSGRRSIARHRGAAQPNVLPHMVAESNSPRAICSACPPDTNILLPTRAQGPGLVEQPQQLALAAVPQ